MQRVFDAYHEWYYPRQFNRNTYRGATLYKWIGDLWNYQEILSTLRPSLVVEFGCLYGGSGLFFSDLLRNLGSGKLLGVDITDNVNPLLKSQDNVELLFISSLDPRVSQRIQELRDERPLFAILDSDHTKDHVLKEMLVLRPLLRKGDYLVVEDGNINGHPVLPAWGPGPWEAIEEYEKMYPNDYTHDREREHKFGFTFAPNGYLVRN